MTEFLPPLQSTNLRAMIDMLQGYITSLETENNRLKQYIADREWLEYDPQEGEK